MSETRLVGDVLAELNRLEGCYAWRNNTGTAVMRGRHVKFSEPGAADILCCYRGRFVAIECKSPTGRQRPDQRHWQAQIEKAGGTYILARSVDAVTGAMGITANHPVRVSRTRVITR